MKFESKRLNIFGGMLQIQLPINLISDAEKIQKDINAGKSYVIDISRKRQKRSLDANAFLWACLADMAAKLHTSKDELYLQMLERYGRFTHIICTPAAVDRVRREFKTVRVLGEVTVNGKQGIQMQVYYGSSDYDSKEFSILLDGVLSEAKEMGLEYISEADKALMLEEWGKKNGNEVGKSGDHKAAGNA